tara:strand:+ start:1820 stop:2227 length:408 start_codon:yes stop_codon:yes gene_type:complete
MTIQVIEETTTTNTYEFNVIEFANRIDNIASNLDDEAEVKTSDFVISVVRAYGLQEDQIPNTLLNKMASDLATKKDELPTIVIYTIDFALSYLILTHAKKTGPDADTGNLIPHMNECWTNIINLMSSIPDNEDDV